jgi:hypothetical protein
MGTFYSRNRIISGVLCDSQAVRKHYKAFKNSRTPFQTFRSVTFGLGPSLLPSERPAIRPSFRITRDGRAKAPAEPLAARCEQERRAGFSGKPPLNSETIRHILPRRLRRSVRPTIAGLCKSRADMASTIAFASDASRKRRRVRQLSAAFRDLSYNPLRVWTRTQRRRYEMFEKFHRVAAKASLQVI